MRSSFFRTALVFTALVLVLSSSAVVAESADESLLIPAADYSIPWWEICPPTPTRHKRRTSHAVETAVETIPAEGYCYTAIKRVNVRSQPSIYATRVSYIKSAGTEFVVYARVKNSSGEIWYAVKLANSTLGYIRSDLLNTDHVILLDDPYSYEEAEPHKMVPASESGSDFLGIATDVVVKDSALTPQVIYIVRDPQTTPAPEAPPTPTPIIIYVTKAPEQRAEPEVTPQVIYVYQDEV